MKVKISKPSVSKVINKKQSNVNSPGFVFFIVTSNIRILV